MGDPSGKASGGVMDKAPGACPGMGPAEGPSASPAGDKLRDTSWINAALVAARPRAVGALLRYFRDLDTAEEAFQEACLRALKSWPDAGSPRDPAAWLILVGRNAALDRLRARAREIELPSDETISDVEDAEAPLVERIDAGHYRDDVLRLLFICCHPELPPAQQVPLALRIVAGLSVKQIARAFLVSEVAMEQRITRAKARIAAAGIPFEAPGGEARAGRLQAVAAMLYLIFNEGYSAGETPARARLGAEAIRLARLLLKLFPDESEVMGLCALMLFQHARAAARFDGKGQAVLLDRQDRALWDQALISEGVALLDDAMARRMPGPYQIQAAIAALHARARRPQETDWRGIDALYGLLERLHPSPVVTLNRAVAVMKVNGPKAALAMIDPLEERLSGYFHFHGARGALLAELGRAGEARDAFLRALALAHSPADAAHVRAQLDLLDQDARPAPGAV